MLNPSIDYLLKEVNESRFKIVIAVARRARDLDDGRAQSTIENVNKKSISLALEELADKKITIKDQCN